MKLSQQIRRLAAVQVTDDDIATINDYTHHNHHWDSLLFIAQRILGDKKLAEVLEAGQRIHQFFGSLPEGLFKTRMEIMKVLEARLKQKVSPEDFKRIQSAL